MFVLLISILLVALGLIYFWLKQQYSYFEGLGIEYDKPTPILGTFKDTMLKKENFIDNLNTVYNKFSSGIVGVFDLKTPVYMIRSPEVINQIAIKDFDHFPNHSSFSVDENCLFGNSLFLLEDQKWKDMRSTLSPAFTGSKMRGMFELIRDIGKETVTFLKSSKSEELDLKDFLSRYANDVIATTAFGFKINSNEEKDNEFYVMGNEVTDFNFFKFFFISNFLKLSKLLKLELISRKHKHYYMKLVLNTMKDRKDHSIFRQDMINMLMEIRGMSADGLDTKKQTWTDVELVAQCFLFFIAGFHTVSNTLCFIFQELMENQDCQDKLRDEIFKISESLDGEDVTYEAISSMKYADAIISEAMRKWPVAGDLDRICTKNTIIRDPVTGVEVNIKKGDRVQLNAVGIQRDEKYFSDPFKFNPERFLGENKKNIDTNTLLSFGLGPRMCIGNRFALLEMKSLMFHLFKEFKFVPHEKSVVPLIKLDPSSMKFEPKGGFWVKLVKI